MMGEPRFRLGDRVRASHIEAAPNPGDYALGDHVEALLVPNPEPDRVGILVGTRNRKCYAEVDENGFGGRMLSWYGSPRRYLVVRYTLRGKRYLTLAKCLTRAAD